MGICYSCYQSITGQPQDSHATFDSPVLIPSTEKNESEAVNKAPKVAVKKYSKHSELSIALKSPHGTNCYVFDRQDTSKSFSGAQNINDWLQNLYAGSHWASWIVYNDQVDKLGFKNSKHGHCKGILAWNDSKFSWLIHSVPDFPKQFQGNAISEIEKSELVYGQSFCYITFPVTVQNSIDKILLHIYGMDPHVYLSHNAPSFEGRKHLHDSLTITKLQLTKDIEHVSKSPKNHIDIYESYLAPTYGPLKVESWIRGQALEETTNVVHIRKLKGIGLNYSEAQDHSKWAISARPQQPWVFIGDLNRMHSQFVRGGGGLVIAGHKNMWTALESVILE